MTTPVGEKDAPAGTAARYDGSMNARRGRVNYEAKNGLNGRSANDLYVGQIHVEVPLTMEFLDYGAGEYSLAVPVQLVCSEAYGSYSSSLYFTPWDELVESGGITMSGTNLYRISQADEILEIDPSVTGITGTFKNSTYKEVDVPSSVTEGYKPFDGSGVKKIVFGEGTTTIPNYFCYNATNLREVILPETVSNFQYYCFARCSALSEINMPQSYTLGNCCFSYCTSIEELHITDGVTVNATSASYAPFLGSGLKRVTVEDGTTTVPAYICAQCAGITELYLPASLTTMGARAFTGMSGLKELTVKSDISQANSYSMMPVFENTGLEKITFTEGVTKVARHMFNGGCTNVTELSLPDTLKVIEPSAFAGCSKLAELEIPVGVTTLGGKCFANATALKELHIRADYALPYATTVSPFEGSGIEKLVFEEGVTTIAAHLFDNGCSNMTDLYLPTSLSTASGYAFRNCTSLKSVVIRSNVDVPRSSVVSPFIGGDIESITYANGVVLVGAYLFNGACSSLTEITLPNTITTIRSHAFDGCSSLSELEIPTSVETLGARAFGGAISLKTMHIRADYKQDTVGVSSPFEGSGVENLIFDEGVTAIAGHLFDDGCAQMTELYLPTTLETVGGYAFENCVSLKHLVVRSNIKPPHATVVSPFNGGDIESIEFADGVTLIGDYIFSNACASMTSLSFPESMREIGFNTFEGCSSLTDLYLPASVEEIGGWGFGGCVSLSTLNMNSSFARPSGADISPFENGGITVINVADGVTEIRKNLFNNINGETIMMNVPISVTKIGYKVFADGADYVVYYAGTEAEWAAIEKDEDFTPSQVICADTVLLGRMMMVPGDEDLMDLTALMDDLDDDSDGAESDDTVDGEELMDDWEAVGDSEAAEPEDTGDGSEGFFADAQNDDGENALDDIEDDMDAVMPEQALSMDADEESEVSGDDGRGEREDDRALCEWGQDHSADPEEGDDGMAEACGEDEGQDAEQEREELWEADDEIPVQAECGADEH